MTATKPRLTDRIQIGVGLISISFAVIALAFAFAWRLTDDIGLRAVVLGLGVAVAAALWVPAVRNERVERDTRLRLKAEHPGALVERVRLWSLPHGRVDAALPVHFIVADAEQISFETIDQTVLIRIPVPEIGLLDPVAAQGDRIRDQALTIIWGEQQDAVQFFTVSYTALPKLRARIRTAIGWPADGIPVH